MSLPWQTVDYPDALQQMIRGCLEDLADAGQTIRTPTVVRHALERYDDLEGELKELAAAEAVTQSLSGMSSLRLDNSASLVGSKMAVEPSPHVDLKTVALPSRHSTCTATQGTCTIIAEGPTPSASLSRGSGGKVSPPLDVTYYSTEQVWPLLLSWCLC
jgi:hypothetical protein